MWGLPELDNNGIKLMPLIHPDQVKIAPKKVFKMTRRCLVTHCKINMWSCVKVNLTCTNLYECKETKCGNQDYGVSLSNDSDYDSFEISESDD